MPSAPMNCCTRLLPRFKGSGRVVSQSCGDLIPKRKQCMNVASSNARLGRRRSAKTEIMLSPTLKKECIS